MSHSVRVPYVLHRVLIAVALSLGLLLSAGLAADSPRASARAELSVVETKVIGEVLRNGYAETGIAVRYSGEIDAGSTPIPAAAFSAQRIGGGTTAISDAYVNDDPETEPSGQNERGEWVILEIPIDTSPADPRGLTKTYAVRQDEALAVGDDSLPAMANAINTSGTVNPELDGLENRTYPASAGHDELDYRFFEPELAEGKRYPLIIALHGRGETGTDTWKQIAVNQLAAAWTDPERQDRNPAFVIAPQARYMGPTQSSATAWGAPNVQNTLLAIIEKELEDNPIDPERIYLTGLSMGSLGSYDLMRNSPGTFAGALTIAFGGPVADAPDWVEMPIWNTHTIDDGAVAYASSANAEAALNDALEAEGLPGVVHREWAANLSDSAAEAQAQAQLDQATATGSKHLFTAYSAGTSPHGTHQSWEQTFLNDVMIDWLFAQGAQPTSVSASAVGEATYGSPVELEIAVDGVDPTGEVRVARPGGGTELATGELEGGATTLTLEDLEVGTNELLVEYLGDEGNQPSEQIVSIEVARASSQLRVALSKKKVRFGQPVSARVTVLVDGGPASGKLTVRSGSVKIGSGRSNSAGRATIKLAGSKLKPKRHRLKVSYAGSETAEPSSATAKLTVKPKKKKR